MPIDVQIQTRHDLAANWTTTNPILALGEAGYETDFRRLKFGDGVTAWSSLPYFVSQIQDMRYGVFDSDDFLNDSWTLGANLSKAGNKTAFQTTGTGSAITTRVLSTGAGGQGWIKLDAGTATNGSVVAFGGGIVGTIGNGAIQLGDGTQEIIWFFESDANLSTATDRYATWLGIASDSTAAPSNFILLLLQDNVNSGKFQLRVTVAGAAQANTNGTTTLVASTKYHGRIVITPSAIKFYTAVYGGVETLEGTYTGTQPASTVGLGTYALIAKSAGVLSRSLYIDGWQYNDILTNTR